RQRGLVRRGLRPGARGREHQETADEQARDHADLSASVLPATRGNAFMATGFGKPTNQPRETFFTRLLSDSASRVVEYSAPDVPPPGLHRLLWRGRAGGRLHRRL